MCLTTKRLVFVASVVRTDGSVYESVKFHAVKPFLLFKKDFSTDVRNQFVLEVQRSLKHRL